jgi:2-polyprenyl-3-methyl-5-hydroxy-6-metoxy-1,4-benzoquinol methylase
MNAEDAAEIADDTYDQATQYLRGQALRMARNVVDTGHAREHVRVLEGLHVLDAGDTRGGGVQITINGFTLAGLPATGPTPLLAAVATEGRTR